ncbi:MAG: TetR/AcrR family transcriptional regulator [Myxococcota bacterium]
MARPRLEHLEAKLLAAGLALFAKYGTEGVNSNLIARQAGTAVGTFYAHFADKYALLRQIELRTLAGLRASRISALRDAGHDPDQQARQSIEATVEFAERHPEAYRVTFGRERAGASRHGPVVSESARPLAEALRQLQEAGRLAQTIDVDLVARAYLSMEVGLLLWWLEDPRRATTRGLVETLSSLHPAVRLPSGKPASPADSSGRDFAD